MSIATDEAMTPYEKYQPLRYQHAHLEYSYEIPEPFIGTCRFCGKSFRRDSYPNILHRYAKPAEDDFCSDCFKKQNRLRRQARQWQKGHDDAMNGIHENPYAKGIKQ